MRCIQGGGYNSTSRPRVAHSIRTVSSTTSSSNGTNHNQQPTPDKEQVTTQTFNTANGRIKIDLSNKSLIGVHQSRGERPYQEDTFAIRSINLPSDEIARTLASSGVSIAGTTSASQHTSSSNDKDAEKAQETEQTLYCAVFDGHNGSQVSNFLSAHLHDRLLTVQQTEANEIVSQYRALGGYMRRYKGGLLAELVDPPTPRRSNNKIARELKVEEERLARLDRGEEDPKEIKNDIDGKVDGIQDQKKQIKKEQKPWNVLQRIEAAFLSTDLEIIKDEQE